MTTATELTADRLCERLHYDPETGDFTSLISHAGHLAGSEAGWFDSRGYRIISVHGRKYQASRLAWLYMTGEWPAHEIDHRNINPSDNRWINLREATRQQNNVNTGLRKDSTSGVKGVCRGGEKTWRARIRINGKRTHLGVFPTIEAAQAAYAAKAAELFADFARVE